jgi:hypothetical protein
MLCIHASSGQGGLVLICAVKCVWKERERERERQRARREKETQIKREGKGEENTDIYATVCLKKV